jgi:hypothetical protein
VGDLVDGVARMVEREWARDASSRPLRWGPEVLRQVVMELVKYNDP